MKKILLVCSAGMSTNLLVTHMEEAAKEANIDVEINAIPSSVLEGNLKGVDVILLSPQVRFQRAKIEELVKASNQIIPIELVEMKHYATMNGKAIFELAMSLIK